MRLASIFALIPIRRSGMHKTALAGLAAFTKWGQRDEPYETWLAAAGRV